VLAIDIECYHSRMAENRVPLFVRLPREQAAALDRLVLRTGRRKQQLVSELLSDRMTVGRIDINESQQPLREQPVLTLEELAELLRVPLERAAKQAQAGEIPGRRVGGEWRFSRTAVLAWLAGESVAHSG
jgi:excisionase family DNA binding protein